MNNIVRIISLRECTSSFILEIENITHYKILKKDLLIQSKDIILKLFNEEEEKNEIFWNGILNSIEQPNNNYVFAREKFFIYCDAKAIGRSYFEECKYEVLK